jgi:hypothetical protein
MNLTVLVLIGLPLGVPYSCKLSKRLHRLSLNEKRRATRIAARLPSGLAVT